MSSFNATADVLLDYLSTMADGKTEISLSDVFARAALDVICKVRQCTFEVAVYNEMNVVQNIN